MVLKRYLFWCANEHVDFRVPEFETIADIFDIDLHWVENAGSVLAHALAYLEGRAACLHQELPAHAVLLLEFAL